MTITVDLHNHSCLSPCASLDNSPIELARLAKERGVDILALTDHNSARNCPAFAEACERHGIVPLFGTETTSVEEVHVLSLFASLSAALDWGSFIYDRLPAVENDPDVVGDQPVVDADETVVALEERFLLSAVDLSLDEIAAATNKRGGLCIPAHIDRRVNSIQSQLGFLPDTPFSALEVTRLPPAIDTAGYTLICSSDAHYPDDIARRPFYIDAATRATSSRSAFDVVAAALAGGAVTLSM